MAWCAVCGPAEKSPEDWAHAFHNASGELAFLLTLTQAEGHMDGVGGKISLEVGGDKQVLRWCECGVSAAPLAMVRWHEQQTTRYMGQKD